MISGLRASALASRHPRIMSELDAMATNGTKADIEAIYDKMGLPGLQKMLVQCLVSRDFWI